jgi:hypothetical protein
VRRHTGSGRGAASGATKKKTLTANFGAAKLLRERGELREVDVRREHASLGHVARVDRENLAASRLVGQPDVHLDLHAAGAQQRRVNHLGTIGHADHENVLEFVDALQQRQHLLHDARVGRVRIRAARLEQRVHLVENDDVQPGLVTLGVLLLFRPPPPPPPHTHTRTADITAATTTTRASTCELAGMRVLHRGRTGGRKLTSRAG